MKLRRYPYWIATGIVSCTLTTANPVWAQQISGDGTLSTKVTSPDGFNFKILGGNRAGGNLFHSFSQFSVPTGGSASFDNSLDVRNIIGRVTGGSVSNIDGLLRANGTANLFLLNPSGIVFGPNAQLNVGGSFLGSTASSLKFGDGTEFRATPGASPPLLTMSVPVGLQYGPSAAAITVQRSSLAVQPDRTLALAGGDVIIKGGNLTAPSGRVELGAVAGAGNVALTFADNQLQLSFPDAIAGETPTPVMAGETPIPQGNVSLTNEAKVNVSGSGGGDVQLAGRQIKLEHSRVEANNQGSQPGGDLTVTASESVEVIGKDAGGKFDSGLFAENLGTGAAGNLSITTGKLIVRGQAQVSAATFGGDGGSLTVNALDSVEIIGAEFGVNSINLPILTSLLTDAHSTGAAGDLTITTKRLTLRDGAVISTGTHGAGAGGNLTVNATDTVEATGVARTEVFPFSSGLSTAVQRTGTGKAGELTVNTSTLILRDGAQIYTGTFNTGDGGNLVVNASESIEVTGVTPLIKYKSPSGLISATSDDAIFDRRLIAGSAGDITINTGRLIVQDGGQVTTQIFGLGGQAGKLTVNATESVEVIGTPSNDYPLGSSSLSSNITAGASNSGDVTINTGRLIIRDTGQIRVNNQGSGNAGNLIVKARSLQLDNQGALTAATASGAGGNINLQVSDLLQMRRNSEISAEAGGTGNGGNIDINTDLLVALQDSNIIADAIEGQGGNIQLQVQGLFRSPESKFTASSQFGVDGVVDVQTPEVDPSSGLVTLPEAVVDVTGLVAQGCSAGGNVASSEFIVTGRGGLPPNPAGTLISETVLPDLGTAVVESASNDSGSAIATNPTSPSPDQIVEATGWAVNANGQVVLTASAPLITPYLPTLTNPTCDRR